MAKLLLAEALKRKKMTKYKFAKLLDERYSGVFRYFREGYDPRLSKLEKFAKALGIRIKDLYKE